MIGFLSNGIASSHSPNLDQNVHKGNRESKGQKEPISLASRSGFNLLDVREDQAISDRLKNYLEKRQREDRTEAAN